MIFTHQRGKIFSAADGASWYELITAAKVVYKVVSHLCATLIGFGDQRPFMFNVALLLINCRWLGHANAWPSLWSFLTATIKLSRFLSITKAWGVGLRPWHVIRSSSQFLTCPSSSSPETERPKRAEVRQQLHRKLPLLRYWSSVN